MAYCLLVIKVLFFFDCYAEVNSEIAIDFNTDITRKQMIKFMKTPQNVETEHQCNWNLTFFHMELNRSSVGTLNFPHCNWFHTINYLVIIDFHCIWIRIYVFTVSWGEVYFFQNIEEPVEENQPIVEDVKEFSTVSTQTTLTGPRLVKRLTENSKAKKLLLQKVSRQKKQIIKLREILIMLKENAAARPATPDVWTSS